MKSILMRFVSAALLYAVCTIYAGNILVIPPQLIQVSVFLPPVLGLLWGPIGIAGILCGELLAESSQWIALLFPSASTVMTLNGTEISSAPVFHALCTFLSAYLPYRLWHSLPQASFTLQPRTLLKFVAVIFLSTLITTLISAGFTDTSRILLTLQSMGSGTMSREEYALLRFSNDFNLAVLAGLPVFFFLLSRKCEFYIPSRILSPQTSSEEKSDFHTLRLPMLFYLSFFGLFLLLDLSNAIYDLDKLDTWMIFNGEILTAMNVMQLSFLCMLLRFRDSIMTDLMMLELVTVFIAAFVLGSISFLAMSRLIDNRIEKAQTTMSTISRERLSRSMDRIRLAVKSAHDTALRQLESYDRLANDPAYREQYLHQMEDLFYPIAANADGSISFYLRCVPDLAGPTSGFYWTRPAGHWEGRRLAFFRWEVTDLSRYSEEELDWFYLPLKRHNPTWIEPYVDVNTNAYVISYSMPLYVEGHPVGVIGMDVDFEYLVHEIRRMSVYEHGFVYLTDRNRHILHHRDIPQGELWTPNPELYETETYLGHGIWLGLAVPIHEIYADRNDMLIHLVVFMLFIAMAIGFFSTCLAMRGIRPLQTLTETVKKISEGNLNVQLAYDSKNEFGTLVKSISNMADKLEIYVYRDKLTGLRNTTAYTRYIEELENRQKTEPFPYAVVLFDANFLKVINDHYGHEAGNELIRCASSVICRVFAHSPVYRIGGDEFIAILEGEDYDHREELLHEFDRQTADSRFTFNERKFPVSIARGIGILREQMDYNAVFRRADEAMYVNKAYIKANQNILQDLL